MASTSEGRDLRNSCRIILWQMISLLWYNFLQLHWFPVLIQQGLQWLNIEMLPHRSARNVPWQHPMKTRDIWQEGNMKECVYWHVCAVVSPKRSPNYVFNPFDGALGLPKSTRDTFYIMQVVMWGYHPKLGNPFKNFTGTCKCWNSIGFWIFRSSVGFFHSGASRRGHADLGWGWSWLGSEGVQSWDGERWIEKKHGDVRES